MASKRMKSSGGRVGQSVNTTARHVRSSKRSAIANRNQTGPKASKSRPMEFMYRGIPFMTPRANIRGC